MSKRKHAPPRSDANATAREDASAHATDEVTMPVGGASAPSEDSAEDAPATVSELVAALGRTRKAGKKRRGHAATATQDDQASEPHSGDERGTQAQPPGDGDGDQAPLVGEEGATEDSETSGGGLVTRGREVRLVDALPIDEDDDLTSVEGEASPRLASIVESLLFSSVKPLTVKDLRRVLPESSKQQVQLALKHLIAARQEAGVVVVQVAGGFVLRTHPDNAPWVQRALQARPVRLSRPQLETLAVVCYRQPVTRAEIDHIRGVDSSATLKVLMERELVQVVGRTEEVGRPNLFGTTVKFLEFFNLRSLRDLPDLRDLAAEGPSGVVGASQDTSGGGENLHQVPLDLAGTGQPSLDAHGDDDARSTPQGGREDAP